MPNPSLDLRGGASGPSFEGSTPGFVLTIDADGKRVTPQAAAAGGLVSFNGRTTPAVVPLAGDVKCTLTLLVPGTLGALTFNITYNDIRGVSVTKAVNAAPLNIAGAAGDEVGAQLIVASDGSAIPSFTVTGVTTPGALSYRVASSVEMQSA